MIVFEKENGFFSYEVYLLFLNTSRETSLHHTNGLCAGEDISHSLNEDIDSEYHSFCSRLSPLSSMNKICVHDN